jgi:hypothetical protein
MATLFFVPAVFSIAHRKKAETSTPPEPIGVHNAA